jgi:PAS domain S-box-containing protein
MGEKPTNFPKAVIQNTLVASAVVAVFALIFHYVPLYDFSWQIVIIFIGVGAFFGFLTGLERVRFDKLRVEKDAMQASFGQIEFSLKRSAHQLRVLLDNLSDAVYQTNEQGRFVYFNQGMVSLTGYNAKELKQSTLTAIQMKRPVTTKENTSLLDNNIYRHVETWKHSDGHEFQVEINTKMVQSGNRLYELHIARYRVGEGENGVDNSWVKEIQHWQYGRIREESQFRDQLFGQLQNTLNGLSTLLTRHLESGMQADAETSKVLADWKRTRNLLQLFISKNNRDKNIRQSFWDLNEILLQELSYLKISMPTDNISIQVQFGSNLLKVKAAGNDLTLALGILLRALCLAISEGGGGKLQVISNMTTESLFAEFHATNSKNFTGHFAQALQMSSANSIVDLPQHKDLPQIFFNYLRLHFDSMEEKDKIVVKLRLPFERQSFDSQPPRPPTRGSSAGPQKTRDYVVL